MKIKALVATLISAVALQGAMAGTSWCPTPDKGRKCQVDCSPDLGASISVGYDTAYVFKGLRIADDSVWFDVNYTFENLPLSPNIGIWHLSELSSRGAGNVTPIFGDETNLYVGVDLPSIAGFDHSLKYTFYLYPTQRGPGQALPGGDSLSELTYSIGREIWCGWNLSYTANYLFGASVPGAAALPYKGLSGWMHTLELGKSFDITDCIALDLTGGVLYNDNYWTYNGVAQGFPQHALPGRASDSGWHSYYLRAAFPIALNCRATLTPYLQYNGTPDGWTGDGMNSGFMGGNANLNDIFFGGVSLNVTF